MHVTGTEPHSLCAVMLLSHVGGVGLQPKGVVPLVQLSNTGAVTTVQVKVWMQVLVNPQAVALFVKLWERLQPLEVIGPGVHVTGTEPHSLCAVILVLHAGGVGLQPKGVVPLVQLSNTGAVTTVQVKVWMQVLVNPQAVALFVKLWERLQPLEVIGPGVHVTGTEPHSLCAVILVLHAGGVGLQPKGVVPLVQLSKTGAVAMVHVSSWLQLAILPQTFVAV